MAEHEKRYDKSSKWMIEHHGDSILRLAGFEGMASWRPRPAEVVQPRQWPDGMLEVLFPDQPEPDYFVVEIATFPESRAVTQLSRAMTLVHMARRVVPEVVVLVLRPKGQYEIPGGARETSRLGTAGMALNWRVVRLWDLKADDLFAAGDVGLVPWIPLTESPDPPEELIRRCNDTIEQEGPPEERENLRAVTQVMTMLRYNEPSLLTLLGGRKMIIESPLVQEIVAETKQKVLVTVLTRRFEQVPEATKAAIEAIQDQDRLDALVAEAASCPDLAAFRRALEQ